MTSVAAAPQAGASRSRASTSQPEQLVEPSRAVGSWLKAAEPLQTTHWQLACTSVLFICGAMLA